MLVKEKLNIIIICLIVKKQKDVKNYVMLAHIFST